MTYIAVRRKFFLLSSLALALVGILCWLNARTLLPREEAGSREEMSAPKVAADTHAITSPRQESQPAPLQAGPGAGELLAKANAALEAQDVPLAKTLATFLLRIDPADEEALGIYSKAFLLGSVLAEGGLSSDDIRSGLVLAQGSLTEKPEDNGVAISLLLSLADSASKKAPPFYAEVLALAQGSLHQAAAASRDPELLEGLGWLAKRQGNDGEMLAMFEAAAASGGLSMPASSALGDLYLARGRKKDARDAYISAYQTACDNDAGLSSDMQQHLLEADRKLLNAKMQAADGGALSPRCD